MLSSFFAVDPVIFAAPASGGVYRSADGGKTWAPAGLADEKVGDLVWLGPFLYAAADGGLFRSEDAGTTWTRLGSYEGRCRPPALPAGPRGRPRGLRGHGPRHLPHGRRRPAVPALRARGGGRAHGSDLPASGPSSGKEAAPMRFAKAHGLGNDFILVAEDLAPAEIGPWARRLCDRHRGIGGDGVLLHAPAPDGIRMRLINADGERGRDLGQRPALPRGARGAPRLGTSAARGPYRARAAPGGR